MKRTEVAEFSEPGAVLDLTQTAGGADVGRSREEMRRHRLVRLIVLVGIPTAYLWYRIGVGRPLNLFNLPHLDPLILMPSLFFLMLSLVLVGQFFFTGRSPHQVVRPEQLDVRLADVVGIDVVKDEVVRSLQLFLSHQQFTSTMGGRPRRALLFEGGPGTGKTYTAKALAAEAGVPFLFATATSFQSSLQGATVRKVRQYFRALRKTARKHGGAVGFIDEFDAIGLARAGVSGMSAAPSAVLPMGCGGLEGLPMAVATAATTRTSFTGGNDLQMAVNELLVQMQSFEEPTGRDKLVGRLVDAVNLLLPPHRQLRGPAGKYANIMLIASTNRADSLDPALLRPGRFDRRLTFELPPKVSRRQLIDHFLARKAHAPELDSDERRDALAAVTQGYSPAMLEGLMDEALIQAVREKRARMSWDDVEHARMQIEIGLGQPVAYTSHEVRLIATHEAGHATVAWLVAPQRRLEILTIIKRRESLGLLAHGDREDVYTRSRAEMTALIQIAMGGQVSEELFFGDVSTGPAGDLMYATNVAAQMVGAAGMTDTLVSYAAVQNSGYSDTNLVGRVLSDSDGRRRVEDMLQGQKTVVRGLLDANQHLVVALRDALLERHELIGSEITDVLEAARAAGPGPQVLDLRDGLRRPSFEPPA
ncbi:MAG: cell division protease FtsH [Actinomycetota bacterium]|jgi:ATP-dependent Zn protease|nr:cell division protease FtsH [Actinomycetota bacterium]